MNDFPRLHVSADKGVRNAGERHHPIEAHEKGELERSPFALQKDKPYFRRYMNKALIMTRVKTAEFGSGTAFAGRGPIS